jgi:hypothetical protein
MVANADSFVYGLAAVDANTGAPGPWNPSANTLALGLTVWDGVLYANGGFFRLGGETTASWRLSR